MLSFCSSNTAEENKPQERIIYKDSEVQKHTTAVKTIIINSFKNTRPGTVAHTCNPITWGQKQPDLSFKASLVYIKVLGQPEPYRMFIKKITNK